MKSVITVNENEVTKLISEENKKNKDKKLGKKTAFRQVWSQFIDLEKFKIVNSTVHNFLKS